MTKDTLSPAGAHGLSVMIQTFWQSRGLPGVRVRVERIKLETNSVPCNIWAIRSNLAFDGNGNIRTQEDDDEEFDARTHLQEPDRDFSGKAVPRSKQSKQGRASRKAKR